MNLLHLIIFQCWGIGIGPLFLDEIGYTPLVGIYYLVEISDRFWVCESMEYWQKGYNEIEGTSSKECTFSSLSFVETGFLRFKRWKAELGLGPGIGLHLLKNRVKERNEYGSWIITEYYCLTYNSIGFHIEAKAGIKFSKISLSGGARVGIVLLSPVEENLFYTRGNLKEVVYLLSISF